jgi:hypothetical protein
VVAANPNASRIRFGFPRFCGTHAQENVSLKEAPPVGILENFYVSYTRNPNVDAGSQDPSLDIRLSFCYDLKEWAEIFFSPARFLHR